MDSHHSRKTIVVSNCVLKAIWNKGNDQMKPLQYTVDILGTTRDESYFTLSINPGMNTDGQSHQSSNHSENEDPMLEPMQEGSRECLYFV